MMDKGDQAPYVDQPMIYHIRVKSHLGRQWTDRFEELRITLQEDGTTLLTGLIADQAALYGVLRKIRDLGLVLLSVNFVSFGLDDSSRDE